MPGQATTLRRLPREPWGIETPVLHVRDATCGEDPHRVRMRRRAEDPVHPAQRGPPSAVPGNAPSIVAAFRRLAARPLEAPALVRPAE